MKMASFLLLLVLAAGGTVAGMETIPYTPRVSSQQIEGKITQSTFALELPQCSFDPFVNASDSIWLVVTYANATASFKNPKTPQQIPPYEALFTSHGYMTMKSTISQYPCKGGNPNAVLRVGGESSCKNDDTQTTCNGPLPSPASFRVKFLVMDSKGPKAETRWSAPIMLKKAEGWKTVDTWPGRRSGDMIVITVILSALCGVVTIGFLSTVSYECFKLCRPGPPENQEEPPRQDPFQGSRYDTHHIPPAPPAPPPPPAMDMPSPHLISTAS